MEINKLVKAAIKGDSSSQKALYTSFAPYIYTICKRYGIREIEQKDMMQEIFIEFYSSLENYDSTKSALKTWARSIAIHKILNFKKKRKLIFREVDEHLKSIPIRPTVIDKLNVDDILEVIAKMPEGYRIVFNMVVIDGYKHEEVAEYLQIRPDSSRSQLHRARKWLQKQLLILNNSDKKIRNVG